MLIQKYLDEKIYSHARAPHATWSCLPFPTAHPSASDMALWKLAVWQIVSPTGISDILGRLLHNKHRIWAWRFDTHKNRVLHIKPMGTDIYTIMADPHRHIWYILTCSNQPVAARDLICSIQELDHDRIEVKSTKIQPSEPNVLQNILDVLILWDYTWIWNNLELIGDENWLVTLI